MFHKTKSWKVIILRPTLEQMSDSRVLDQRSLQKGTLSKIKSLFQKLLKFRPLLNYYHVLSVVGRQL